MKMEDETKLDSDSNVPWRSLVLMVASIKSIPTMWHLRLSWCIFTTLTFEMKMENSLPQHKIELIGTSISLLYIQMHIYSVVFNHNSNIKEHSQLAKLCSLLEKKTMMIYIKLQKS